MIEPSCVHDGDDSQQDAPDERTDGEEYAMEPPPNPSLLSFSIGMPQIAYTLANLEDEDEQQEDDGEDHRNGDDAIRPPSFTRMHHHQAPEELHNHQRKYDVAKTKRRNGGSSCSTSGGQRVTPDTREQHPSHPSPLHDGAAPTHFDTRPDTSSSSNHHQIQESAVSPSRTGNEPGEPDRSSVSSADMAIWNIVQLLKPSSMMDKQIYMSVGALVLSFVLGACALCFRDAIFEATHVNSGLILGSAGSLAMCSIIIGTYLTTKWYRRHMHILLVNLATFDFLLALSFVLEPVWKNVGGGVGDGLTCRWVRVLDAFAACGLSAELNKLMPTLSVFVCSFASYRLCAST